MPGTIEHVAIVGAGVSGVFQALALLRQTQLHVTLIEQHDQLARGLAYSTTHPSHLLNVRACNMSAHADAPNHFTEWLQARSLGGANDYVLRKIYGEYLADQLEQARATAGSRLQIVRGAARDLNFEGGKIQVSVENHASVRADTAILALGHFRPNVLHGIDAAALEGAYINNPWSAEVRRVQGQSGTILLAGTGMTTVDVAFQLFDEGFDGRIVAVSRRGLLPLSHPEQAHAVPPRAAPVTTTRLSRLVSEVRAQASSTDWRVTVDQLRPYLQSLWQQASLDEKRRFLRHLRPWWDIHRHRLAPAASQRIARLVADGRLEIGAGKFLGFERNANGIAAHWRPRGTDAVRTEHVNWIINCTGPGCDIQKSQNPLLENLLNRGALRPGFARMGIDVTPDAQVIDANGTAAPNLYALGPLARGALWEITAVPEIRAQTQQLAQKLSLQN